MSVSAQNEDVVSSRVSADERFQAVSSPDASVGENVMIIGPVTVSFYI